MSLLDPRTIYRDRFAAVGAAPIDLYALMVPSGYVNVPTSWAITSGNASGHWTLTGSVLDFSAAGDTANMPNGTYSLGITANWSQLPSPYNTTTAILTAILPSASVYIDSAGDDSAAGTSAAPWAHNPDSPLAAANSLAFRTSCSTPTLVVHRGGAVFKDNVIASNINFIHASNVGYGTGRAIYAGYDIMTSVANTITTPTSSDVSANPNFASMKKYTFSVPRFRSQHIVDNGTLTFPAQWPAPGADPFLDCQDALRHLTGGMFQLPIAQATVYDSNTDTVIVPHVANNQVTITCPEMKAEFGTLSLVGYTCWMTVDANAVGAFNILTHDVAAGTIGLRMGTSVFNIINNNLGFQVVGHPWSVKAPGQYSWSTDYSTFYAWLADGTKTEMPVRRRGFQFDAVSLGTVYGMAIQGYYGTSTVSVGYEGSGISVSSATGTNTLILVDNKVKWSLMDTNQGAGIYQAGVCRFQNHLIEGNEVYDCVRSSGIRLTSGGQYHQLRCNYVHRITRTALYMAVVVGVIVEFNSIKDCVSMHGNGYTFYTSVADHTFRYNTSENVIRPMTLQTNTNLLVTGNILEGDQYYGDASRIYVADPTGTWNRNMFMLPRNKTFPGQPALISASKHSVYIDRSIMDAVSGAVDTSTGQSYPAITNSLILHNGLSSSDICDDVIANAAPNSGNVYFPFVWDGTINPRFGLTLGVGRMGHNRLIYSVASVVFVDLFNVTLNTLTYSAWRPLTTSSATRPISITGGEYSIADDGIGTNATAYTSSSGTVVAGKYIRLRVTSAATYTTTSQVTLDLGDGNFSVWSITSTKASGWPTVDFDITDQFVTPAGALCDTNSPYATIAFAVRPDSFTTTSVIAGHSTGSIKFSMSTLGSARYRINVRNAAGTILAQFNTPVLSASADILTLLFTIDTSQPSLATGVKMYIDGVSQTPQSPTWNTTDTDRNINWAYAGNANKFGLFAGGCGMFFLDNKLADITLSAVRDKFSALQIGLNGQNVFGTPPAIFLVGPKADWEAVGGINRGIRQKYIKSGSTVVSPGAGGKTTWPSFTFATAFTITGPASTVEGQGSRYTLTPNGAIGTSTPITFNDSGQGGSFTPLTFTPDENPTGTFTYTPTTAGAATLTAVSGSISASPFNVTILDAPASTYNITPLETTFVVNQAIDLLIQLNGSNVNGVTLQFALTNLAKSFSQNPLVVEAGTTNATIQLLVTAAGSGVLSAINDGGLTNPGGITLIVSPDVANVILGYAAGLGMAISLAL